MKLYDFWESSTAYRVRIALNLKRIAFQTTPVDLTEGAQKTAAYAAVNPSKAVPTLVMQSGETLTQSMAIISYLEATAPNPPLLPTDPIACAKVTAAAHTIALDVHPVNNLRIRKRLAEMGHQQAEVVTWMNDWMHDGFSAFQAMIDPDTRFAFGDQPTLADICLIPQLYNAHKWGLDMSPFDRLTAVEEQCLALPAFQDAHPENHRNT